jgi:serine/threonine protein kinase
MSPEMLWPERFGVKDAKATKESDVYALGILIYEVRALFVAQPRYLRQRANRSFVGIDLTQN